MIALTGFQGMSDYLVSFLIWSLAVFGTANIIVFSTIFKPIRDALANVPVISKLINCILCMGFWVGSFWGYFTWNPAEFLILRMYNGGFQTVLDLLFNGALGSCVCWLIYLFIADKMLGK
jgi:hypothetical protein